MAQFRPWQAEAFEYFWQGRRCYLISPPGQGKSVAGQAFALYWKEQGKKVLIATPRKLITQSFKGEITLQWDEFGKTGAPDAPEHTFKYNDPQDEYRLSSWLIHRLDPEYPYFITTHQGALSALRTLNKKYGNTPSKFKNLAVVIDEAHLMSDSEGSQLGKVLKDLIEADVPVFLMTGTSYRGDNQPVLPPELEKEFRIYNREFYLALDESKYLGGFETRVVVGNTLTVLRHLLERVIAEDRYVVVKLPTVNTHHAIRLAKELGIEVTESNVLKELKPRFDSEIEAMCKELGLSHTSIVMRDSKELDDILAQVRHETDRTVVAQILPRVIVAQEKIGLGVDCPWWTDAVMLGASKSCTQTVQFGMRCCRDHFSKDGRSVTYWTLVPEYWEPEVTSDQALEFAKDLVTIQLWWHFMGGGPVAPELKTSQVLPSVRGSAAKHAVPPSPKSQTEAALRSHTSSYLEGSDTPLVTVKNMPCVAIERCHEDGTREVVKVGNVGDGNKLYSVNPPDLPEGVVNTGNFLSQLTHLAEVLVSRGKGKEYHSFLKKSQITSQLIGDLFKEGSSIGEISAKTGWTARKVEKALKTLNLVETKVARPRIRGFKEDCD